MPKHDFRKSRVGAHQLQPETLMLGFGFDPTLSEGAVKPPIFLTSTFAYDTCEEGKLLFDYMSGRQVSPKGANACSVFSSGMAD